MSSTLPLRLRRVAGLDARRNDVLYMPPRVPPAGQDSRTLVFFGGDVQDYPEVMQAHRDNRHYVKWNLENTARMLSHSFPDRHVLVVRPSRIEYKSFSCYDNFVPSNNTGVPEHTPTHSALHHLEKLLQGVSSRVLALPTPELLEAVTAVSLPEEIDIEDLHKSELNKWNGAATSDAPPLEPNGDPLWWRHNMSLDESRLSLCGFSKGCVVLNQFVYEFHYTKTLTPGDTNTLRFMDRIESIYWLDGGHAGGKNTWITARSLLETLTRLDVDIHIHVSPYQIHDDSRPWIGREEKLFTSLLRKLGAKVDRHVHAGGVAGGAGRTLLTHFGVLGDFPRVAHTPPPPAPAPASDAED